MSFEEYESLEEAFEELSKINEKLEKENNSLRKKMNKQIDLSVNILSSFISGCLNDYNFCDLCQRKDREDYKKLCEQCALEHTKRVYFYSNFFPKLPDWEMENSEFLKNIKSLDDFPDADL